MNRRAAERARKKLRENKERYHPRPYQRYIKIDPSHKIEYSSSVASTLLP